MKPARGVFPSSRRRSLEGFDGGGQQERFSERGTGHPKNTHVREVMKKAAQRRVGENLGRNSPPLENGGNGGTKEYG